MRYLITGGAGFIGSHLSEALLARGAEVFILDDLSTGSVENIRHLKANGRFHYFFDSIQNKQLLAELVDESDIVIHLAAAVGVRLIVESPVRTLETNIHGTQFVLDAASKKKKLVFIASTSEVYGSGKQSRCFSDVRDCVEALLRLLANEKAIGEVVNIGTDEEISIEGLARVVKERTGSDSPITYVPYDQAYEPGFEDMPRRVPSLEKLESLTGFRPATSLVEIVDRVIAHCKNRTDSTLTPAPNRLAAHAATD